MRNVIRPIAALLATGIALMAFSAAALAAEATATTELAERASAEHDDEPLTPRTTGYSWSRRTRVVHRVLETGPGVVVANVRETSRQAVGWVSSQTNTGWDTTRTIVANGRNTSVRVVAFVAQNGRQVVTIGQDKAGNLWAFVRENGATGKTAGDKVIAWAIGQTAVLDTNGDGNVDGDDAQDAVEDVVETVLDPLDLDGDGDVDWDDLRLASGATYAAILSLLTGG